MNETITREQKQRKRIEIPRLAVSNIFGKYKKEEKKAVRAPEVIEDQTLNQLRQVWVNFQWKDEIHTWSENYPRCLKATRGIQYTSKDVEKFGIALAEFADMEGFPKRAGIFLSALINKCPERDFVIHTRHLRIDCLGYKNSKNVIIDGDIGAQLGSYMKGGRITVEGNTRSWSGISMENGEIIINGDCGWAVGQTMTGGKITVKGNAGEDAGKCMTGGKIIVNGNAGKGAGSYMKGGIVEIKGNAGECAGNYLASGEIIVDGDCSEKLGNNMHGGRITVKGNAGISAGEEMNGGEIHIEGKYKRLSKKITRGKIYHKGKLKIDQEYGYIGWGTPPKVYHDEV